MRNAKICLVLAAFSLALSACSLAPIHKQPATPVPAAYPLPADETAATGAAMPDWEDFIQEPHLRLLIRSALIHNRDLRQALLNIEAAQAQYRIQRADRLPTVNANGALDRQRIPDALSQSGQGGVQSTYRADIGLSAFELDLFGRTRNLSQAALQEYLATEQAARGVRISLIANVSEAYVRYTAAQTRIALTSQTLEARETSLELIRLRLGVGTAGEVDLQESISLVEQATTELLRTQRESEQARNALQLLVGENALGATLTPASIQGALFQNVPAGLPSELLTRRPDVVAAEHRIRARNADIGAARAAFFPRITLTGSLGSASPELSDLFSSGTRAWQFLPQITLPIFAAGRNRANLDLAQIRKESSIVEFEKTIQIAFTEVADALVARSTLQQQMASQSRLVASSEQTLRLAELRYRGGVDSHLRYLDAKRQDFSNRLALLDTWSALQGSRIGLYKALGGDEGRLR
ncbi:efflux transporter outer membrane subunit [Acidovorax sp. SUPP1855]|uniref:efflux transporter outer membrane subunit n=1 Tax=Acidovorax sp. SUPP1855 TaxID=431774 RepID=UPI0023DE6556|nr:efflux transporter outer membrane subunit [Acidovorax sp. SUPP1855]GKS84394.1 efflux transporter outer membrane subunit [Acidovorax sp. SUPP1855]